MSSERDDLPPARAPLAVKLRAAMRGSAYPTQRKLGEALGTDGSLVGKWLNGKVESVTQERHLEKLPTLLRTPPDYFDSPSRADRLAKLEARVDRLYAETARGFEALGHLQHGLVDQEEDQEPRA